MDKYTVIRTDTADSFIHKIILDVAERFGTEVALEKLEELEVQIMSLADNPHLGMKPRYMILRRMGYRVLITDKNLIFYKIYEESKTVIVYVVVDQRQNYLDIIRGL